MESDPPVPLDYQDGHLPLPSHGHEEPLAEQLGKHELVPEQPLLTIDVEKHALLKVLFTRGPELFRAHPPPLYVHDMLALWERCKQVMLVSPVVLSDSDMQVLDGLGMSSPKDLYDKLLYHFAHKDPLELSDAATFDEEEELPPLEPDDPLWRRAVGQ